MTLRFLLLAEGRVDERTLGMLAAERGIVVVPRQLPARGIAKVRELLPDSVRAAWFGSYDGLLVHVDADEPPPDASGRRARTRAMLVAELEAVVADARRRLPPLERSELAVVLAVPRQTTDTWLWWGRDGGGPGIEERDRHQVKGTVYGPARVATPAALTLLIDQLRARLAGPDAPPPTLVELLTALGAGRG